MRRTWDTQSGGVVLAGRRDRGGGLWEDQQVGRSGAGRRLGLRLSRPCWSAAWSRRRHGQEDGTEDGQARRRQEDALQSTD